MAENETPMPTVQVLERPKTATQSETQTKEPWLWNVVLLDDDDHTYDYVMQMVMDLFAKPIEGAFRVAQTVDTHGRAVLLTTHKEHAELKRDQVHAFGADTLIAGCAGSMTAVLEPASDEGGDQESHTPNDRGDD